jgi:hypothetical protein
VDTGSATALGVTLIAWQLESAGTTHLVGAAELGITAPDRTVRTEVIRGSEDISPSLPGDLAAAAGRLLNTLATESFARAKQSPSSDVAADIFPDRRAYERESAPGRSRPALAVSERSVRDGIIVASGVITNGAEGKE